MSTSKFNFTTGLRGFHVYEETWKPSPNQTVTFKQEKNNRYDRFAIAGTVKLRGTLAPLIAGNIPR